MKNYMGHFGSLEKNYYSDNENKDFSELYPLEDKIFENYSDNPVENYRYEMRQPAMLPVKRSIGQYEDVQYYYGDATKPIESSALIVREKINASLSNNPSQIVQEQVKQISQITVPENKVGKNILLGLGAVTALFLINR